MKTASPSKFSCFFLVGPSLHSNFWKYMICSHYSALLEECYTNSKTVCNLLALVFPSSTIPLSFSQVVACVRVYALYYRRDADCLNGLQLVHPLTHFRPAELLSHFGAYEQISSKLSAMESRQWVFNWAYWFFFRFCFFRYMQSTRLF